MANYISSNANRFYAIVESAYGQAAPVASTNRFPASKLAAHQILEPLRRLEKTGTRTFQGTSPFLRRITSFEVKSYLSSWNGANEPGYGPLFRSALGSASTLWAGATIATVNGLLQFQTLLPHGLGLGSAVAAGGEIRFVTAIPDANTLSINAPFSQLPQINDAFLPTLTYRLASNLPSLTLYDYWDPISALSRLVTGAGVDHLGIQISGDYHEFHFSGPAADLLDSETPLSGSSGIDAMPAEPALQPFDLTGVPGHLGQAWFGNPAMEYLTLTEANIELRNNLQIRNHEFGSLFPRAIVPGPRQVMASFSVLAQDDQQTKLLYVAAKQRRPLPFMLQLGLQSGRLMGVYLPAVIPELPEFNDQEARLQYKFSNNISQGVSDDELVIAFA